jgi:hypothetical protein
MTAVPAFPLDIPNPVDSLLGGVGGFVGGLFSTAAGWAWDTVIKGIANWLAKGFVLLLSFVWSVMDSTSTPVLSADWFSGRPGSPYQTTARLGGVLTVVFLFMAVLHATLTADPAARLVQLPKDVLVAVAGVVYLVAFASVAIALTDAATAYVWQQARPDAERSADAIAKIAMTADPQHFLTPLLLLVGMFAMLALWMVLFVREGLIYLVAALAPLSFAARVWPALRGVTRRTVELLAALIVSKLPIGIALSVGFAALGGVGATTGAPPDPAGANTASEFGTFIAGIAIFGIAAFMPYLVWKLLPMAEGALVAQGVASGPHRAVQTGVQYGYYAQRSFGRLTGAPTALTAGPDTVSVRSGPAAAGGGGAGGGGTMPQRGGPGPTPGAGRGGGPMPPSLSPAGGASAAPAGAAPAAMVVAGAPHASATVTRTTATTTATLTGSDA